MKTIRIITGVWGALLVYCVNTYAEPVDQQSYLSSISYQTERKQHVWPDGARYEGEWLKNQPHGYGSLTYANGAQYWGRFDHGRREGEGMMKYANGDEYEGTWHQDQPQGKGKRRYAAGSVYEGDFKTGLPNGQGRQTYIDGTYYNGSWKDGKPHGYGKLTFVTGGSYEGSFERGKPHGKGHYNYPNGDVYSGEWREGNQDGKGRIDYSTGGYYEGEFVDGMRHGNGKMVSAMGSVFEGPFKHNQAHGEGICTKAGKSNACRYRRDKQVKSETLVAKAPKPATKPTAKPVAKTAPTLVVAVASVATVATTTGTQATAAVKAPVKAPIKAPVKVTATAAKQPQALIPVAKPFVPTTGTVATTEQLRATKTKYSAATMAIPSAKQQFTNTLEQEKQKAKHLTVADLRNDRSDIYFNENWAAKDLMSIPETAWWNKRASLFADAVDIVSVHGDTEIRMVIGNYKGPGKYNLKAVSVESESGKLAADRLQSGEITVETEEGEWISGSFQFTVNDDNGQQLAFDHGAFRLSTKSSLPNIYR